MKVIFYNDDYGLSKGFTDAIVDCIKSGITTSSCVRTNGTSFEYGAHLNKGALKNIITGIHLNLTEGKAENENLADDNKIFKYKFINYLNPTETLLNEIEKEFVIQIEKALKAGFKIDHINSQEHVHMIPAIFELTCKIAKKYKIKKIRITHESYYLLNNQKDLLPFINTNLIKYFILNSFSSKNILLAKKYKLTYPDHFCGILHTNNMDEKSVINGILNANKNKVKTLEILAHPAYSYKKQSFTSHAIKNYVLSENRKIETMTFLDKDYKIRNFLKGKKIESISYSDLAFL